MLTVMDGRTGHHYRKTSKSYLWKLRSLEQLSIYVCLAPREPQLTEDECKTILKQKLKLRFKFLI